LVRLDIEALIILRRRHAPTALPVPMSLAALLPTRPVAFFGRVLLASVANLGGRWHFRRQDFARVLADSSANALPIVLVVNVLVGAILAFVGAVQLLQFGAGIFVADLVAIAMVRELAAVITAVVMAGRTGAAFAAELATMRANEEIDALEVLGLDAVEFLVQPRFIALALMMPLMFIYACMAGLAGGMLVGVTMLELPPAAYINRTIDALSLVHFTLGISKALVFGALLAVVGCYCGLNAVPNAAGVGQATTRAVVASILGVVIINALFALCANALNI
jgi:phospholipid/cholesterol/gamma-HCH transport system permease protein